MKRVGRPSWKGTITGHLPQDGFMLIELMIALTISLLLMLVISRLYMSSYVVQKSEDDITQLNEGGRFGLDLISRELRKAGFRNNWEIGSTAPVFCSSKAVSFQNAGPHLVAKNDATVLSPASPDFTTGTQINVANNSDVLRVRYFGEGTTATSAIADCQGYPVAAGTLVEDTIYVATDPNNGNEPALWCGSTNTTSAGASSTRAPIALVTGVESLQLLYGEDTDGDGIVNQFLPWRDGVTVADNILAVKASIVVRAPNKGNVVANSTFQHFSANYPSAANGDAGAVFSAPPDNRIRKLFSSEIALRNFRYCDALN